MRLSKSQLRKLLEDNPNLSTKALSMLTGYSWSRIKQMRGESNWRYSGKGIPFTCFVNASEKSYYKVSAKGRILFSGGFTGAIEQVDRLIYCLENNSGELPPAFKEWIFKDLELTAKP